MEVNPLVSIIIPVYNGSIYLEEAIESALSQSYSNIEVLVINDGSKDDGATEKICKKYYDRIRYFFKPNGGVASALNLGIREMKGDFFSWLSHDDLYKRDKISIQIEAWKNLKRKDLIFFSSFQICDEKLNEIRRKADLKEYLKGEFQESLVGTCFINGCTILIPKICFDQAGLFNEKLRTTQDYEMWFRLSQKFEFIYLDEALIIQRLHKNQDSVSKRKIHLLEADRTTSFLFKELIKRKGKLSEKYLLGLFMSLFYQGFRESRREVTIEIIRNFKTLELKRKITLILFVISFGFWELQKKIRKSLLGKINYFFGLKKLPKMN